MFLYLLKRFIEILLFQIFLERFYIFPYLLYKFPFVRINLIASFCRQFCPFPFC